MIMRNLDILFIGSWIIFIFEFILIQLSVIPLYKIGIPVFNKDYEFDSSAVNFKIPLNVTLHATEGKFNFSSPKNVYFSTRFSVLNLFRINTPFLFKGTAIIEDISTIRVKGRLPIGTSIFFISFIVVWTYFVLSEGIIGNYETAIFMTIIGWSGWSLIIFISYKLEKSRFETMIYELSELIKEHNIR